MNKLLVHILYDIVKNDPEKCKEIIYQRSLVFYRMVANSMGTNIEVWNIIPFFWQYTNKRPCCLPGASKGKTWGLLSEILYDDNRGVYAVKCWNHQSGPPDEDEMPIEMVADSVIVAMIHLLLANISPLSSSIDITLLFNKYKFHNNGNKIFKFPHWLNAYRIACRILKKYNAIH